jgi:hypothetical protein
MFVHFILPNELMDVIMFYSYEAPKVQNNGKCMFVKLQKRSDSSDQQLLDYKVVLLR